jgi:hypothetical protein
MKACMTKEIIVEVGKYGINVKGIVPQQSHQQKRSDAKTHPKIQPAKHATSSETKEMA